MPGSLAKSRAARSVERPRTRNSRDWTSRPSAQRLLQLVDVILPERVLGERREASRSGGRAGGGQAEARPLRGRWHDLTAPLRGRSEDAVVAHEVSPRRRDQRRETTDQLARLEDEDIAAVAEAPLHAVRKACRREAPRAALA